MDQDREERLKIGGVFVDTVKELLAYSYVRDSGKYHDYVSN